MFYPKPTGAADADQEFKAVCPVTGFVVMRAYTRATAGNIRCFLAALQRDAPFAIASIQVDGGTEFMAEFEEACGAQNIPLFVLPPRSPKRNGCVERANATSRYEFYPFYRGALTAAAMNRELAEYQRHYNHFRPHDGIGLETPMGYYQQLAQTA